MGKQHGSEHVAQWICLRSEVPVPGRSGLAHSHDDNYRACQNPAIESAGRRWASLKQIARRSQSQLVLST